MHPLEKFRYCPRCSSSDFTESSPQSKRCGNCGFEYFMNASAAYVALIVNENDELLVLTRGREPAKGTLDLPGGFSEIGETAEEGVRREVLEETGLTVDKAKYLFSQPNVYPYSGINIFTLDSFSSAKFMTCRPSKLPTMQPTANGWLSAACPMSCSVYDPYVTASDDSLRNGRTGQRPANGKTPCENRRPDKTT